MFLFYSFAFVFVVWLILHCTDAAMSSAKTPRSEEGYSDTLHSASMHLIKSLQIV